MYIAIQEGFMFRTTIMLPLELKLKAEEKALQLRISLGEYIRKALRDSLFGEIKGKTMKDAFLSDRAVYSGHAPKDLAKRHDDYLYGGRAS